MENSPHATCSIPPHMGDFSTKHCLHCPKIDSVRYGMAPMLACLGIWLTPKEPILIASIVTTFTPNSLICEFFFQHFKDQIQQCHWMFLSFFIVYGWVLNCHRKTEMFIYVTVRCLYLCEIPLLPYIYPNYETIHSPNTLFLFINFSLQAAFMSDLGLP